MIVGIAATAALVIYNRAIPPKEKPILDDLRSQYDLVIEDHANCAKKNSSVQEESKQHFEKLKENEALKEVKWDEVVTIGKEFKDHRHLLIETL